MDIQINAKNHKHVDLLTNFCTKLLTEAFAEYPFISSSTIKVTDDKTKEYGFNAQLELHVKKGAPILATASNPSDTHAVKMVIDKAKGLVERYKEKHYHGLFKKD